VLYDETGAFVTEPATTPYREVPVKTPANPPD